MAANKTTGSGQSAKSNQPMIVNFYGDNYGEKDFHQKVAKTIVEGFNSTKANVTGAR